MLAGASLRPDRRTCDGLRFPATPLSASDIPSRQLSLENCHADRSLEPAGWSRPNSATPTSGPLVYKSGLGDDDGYSLTDLPRNRGSRRKASEPNYQRSRRQHGCCAHGVIEADRRSGPKECAGEPGQHRNNARDDDDPSRHLPEQAQRPFDFQVELSARSVTHGAYSVQLVSTHLADRPIFSGAQGYWHAKMFSHFRASQEHLSIEPAITGGPLRRLPSQWRQERL
jgi:hypothetical protein